MSTTGVDGGCSKDDLTALIRSIKFAYPDYGARKVHREITEKAALKEPSLSSVKLGDVKKIWKKLGLSEHAMSKSSQDEGEILKFYTVGDGSVKSIVDEYSSAADTLLQSKAELSDKEKAEAIAEAANWVHLWLDVPADRSGEKPYQALINFNDKRKAKKGLKAEVAKIQIAAGPGGNPLPDSPMLLYTQDRSAKTFIHPDADGYAKIHDMIASSGTTGALGVGGGSKAYFHCRVHSAQGVIGIETSSLVPSQTW
eukprot:CAMPEP_0116042378 /NCGR_PEP_ID=MMETSP0321-20121206/25642_1 /TAXON_ID=163516 /ORGANISM="Leptocylindrus danicus var. danicus, Strain B650" /LENGTH=254 /DNA_ID=CAMNT_0003522819 /DNA_START=146 /DNA_END=907 /DNA_ORIENTATION=+